VLGAERHQVRLAAGEGDAPEVGLVAGIGDDRGVARPDEREGEVRDALLRADEREDLGDGIDLDAEAAPHPRGHRLAELRQAGLEAVARVREVAATSRSARRRPGGGSSWASPVPRSMTSTPSASILRRISFIPASG
jgi:hypothetical protein